jgi:hypothetical protein
MLWSIIVHGLDVLHVHLTGYLLDDRVNACVTIINWVSEENIISKSY